MKYYKEQTQNLPITRLPEPEYVYIPLSQHTGAPAKPLVKPGDKVLVGQLIGAADAFVTASVHASVSGEVIELSKIKNAQGIVIEAIKIKNDKQNTLWPELKPAKALSDLTPEEIRNIVRESGLVGMGGAAFPTHVKLAPPEDKKVDTLILNAAECEPYLTADHRLLVEKTQDVLDGLKALAKAVNTKKIFIGIEDNKPEAIAALRKILTAEKSPIKIKVLKTAYPMGAEKVLVKKVINRKVPNKGIPLDVGVVVCNVGTAYQLAQTLRTGLPLIERVVTVSGAFSNPGNYQVKIGTLYKDIVKIPAELETSNLKIIAGGPMMGFAVENLEIPVVKGTSGILLLKKTGLIETNCIRCGKCIAVCPLGLQPYQDQGLDECMECGRCAYECPANRFLVQKAKLIKKQLQKVK